MGKFNFAANKALKAKIAGFGYTDQDAELDAAEARRKEEQRARTVAPAPAPVGGRRSYDDFDDVEEPANEWDNYGAEPAQADPSAEAASAMSQWASTVAQNPRDIPTIDLRWTQTTPVNGDHGTRWFDLFKQTVFGVLRQKGWKMPQIESLIGEAAVKTRQQKGLDTQTGTDAKVSVAPSLKQQEPHVLDFSKLMNREIMSNPMVKQMLGTGNMARWPTERQEAFSDAMFTAFGAPFDKREGAVRNEVRFFSTQDNVKYLPDGLRQQIEPLAPMLPRDRELGGGASPTGPEAKQAVQQARSILSQPENLKACQQQLQALFSGMQTGHDTTGTLNSIQDKQMFLMSAASRLKQEMFNREQAYKKRQTETIGTTLDGGDGEAPGLGSSVVSNEDGKGGLGSGAGLSGVGETGAPSDKSKGNFHRDRQQSAEQKLVQEQAVQKEIQQIGGDITKLEGEIRNLGNDLATFVSKSKPKSDLDPATLKTKAVKLLRNQGVKGTISPEQLAQAEQIVRSKSGGKRQDNFATSQKIRAYTQAISESLKAMADPNNVKSEELLRRIATKQVKLKGGDQKAVSDFSRPSEVPDVDPSKQYQPQQPDSEAWNLGTNFDPSKSYDEGKYNRTSLLRLVEEQELVTAVRGLANQYMSRADRAPKNEAGEHTTTTGRAFQNVGNMLNERMDSESQPKQKMRDLFPQWAVFLAIPEVQKQYSVAARRLLMDLMPMKPSYATGADDVGSWAPIYHAARGELHKSPSMTGYKPGDPARPGNPQTADSAMAKVREEVAKARQSAGFSAVNRRWQRLHRAKGQAEQMKQTVQAMNARNLMLKVAQVDTSYIDAMIAHIDSELDRECGLFFNALRSA